MTKGLSRDIRSTSSSSLSKGVALSNFDGPHTHCLFVDDTLFFGQASVRQSKVIKGIIEDYTLALGQLVNPEKSKKNIMNVSLWCTID